MSGSSSHGETRATVKTGALAALIAALLTGLLVLVAGLAIAPAHAEESDPDPEATATSTTDPESSPSPSPSADPSPDPTPDPTGDPTAEPTPSPTTDPTSDPTVEPTTDPTEVPDTDFEVTDALLRWGINPESNNRGAAPGTFNFFSAGKLSNPGSGGQLLTEASKGAKWANGKKAGWAAKAGKVRIEKAQPDGSYKSATWAGLKTDRWGETLGGYSVNTKFSDHQVVLTGGTGKVDPATGTATIKWKGDFTVVYYSGYSFFYVSDPVLTIEDGVGRLTATMSGYGSDIDDISKWVPVPAKKNVVLADLCAPAKAAQVGNCDKLDLSADLGLVATPKYLGVKVTGVEQNTGGQWAGSFPQSFINFAKSVGIDAYWFSSGGAVDKNKPPYDLAVSYSAGNPVVPKPPEPEETTDPPDVDNTAPPPPNPPLPVQAPIQPPGPALPVQAPAAAVPTQADALNATTIRPVTTVLPAGADTGIAGAGSSQQPIWIAGIVVLLLTGLTAASPAVVQLLNRKP